MAKFDEEKFRALATAAGYGKDEIDAEVRLEKAPSGAAVPNIVPIADGRETTAAFQAEAKIAGEELLKSAKEEQEATLAAPPFDFMKAINSPVGYVTGGAALGALGVGAAYGLSKLKTGLSGINQRKIGQQPIDRTIDIPMDTVEKRNMSPFAQQFEATYNVSLADAERITGGPITNPKDAAIIGGALKNQGSISVNNPYQISPYTQAPAPVASTASAPQTTSAAPVAPTDPFAPRPNPYMTPSVEAGVETGNTAKAVQTVLAKEIDQASGMYRDAQGNMVYPKGMSPAARTGAEAFSKQYPDISKQLEINKQFGILGGGSGDNNLFNSYDFDLAKRLRNEINQGQMVGPYENYKNVVNPAVKGISPETAIGKELAQLPEKGGNFGKLGIPATIGGVKGGLITGENTVPKAIKAGGPAMLLMAMADAAKAASEGNFGPLKETGFDVGLSAIPHPGVQAVIQGLTGTTLEPGTLPNNSFQAFENTVLKRKGIKEEIKKITEGKTGKEYNAIRYQYLYSNPRAVSDYDRASQFFRNQARQPVPPR